MPFLHQISATGKVLSVKRSPWLPPSALYASQVLLPRAMPVGSLVREIPQYNFTKSIIDLGIITPTRLRYYRDPVRIEAQPFAMKPTRVALTFVDARNYEQIARCNVWIPMMEDFCTPETHILVKNYSENEGMLDTLIAAGCTLDPMFELENEFGVLFPAVKLPDAWLDQLGINNLKEPS